MKDVMRLALAFIWVLLLGGQSVSLAAPVPSPRSEEEPAPDQVFDKLQVAALQHETITQLIDQEQFSAVIPELKKIFELDLPQEYAIYVVQEIQSIVDRLRDKKELAIAHAAVDLGLSSMGEDRFKSTLYLLKAQLYRDNGQVREASEAAELARRLYRSPGRANRQ